MNDDFGQVSYLDNLPDSYGGEPSRVIRRVGSEWVESPVESAAEVQAAQSNPIADETSAVSAESSEADYSGLFGKKKDKSSSDESKEKGAFWANLSSALGGGSSTSDPGYEDLGPGKGGYTYRRYADGRIEILSGPANKGKVYSATSQAAKNVTAEFGPYKGGSTKTASTSSVSSADKVAKGAAIGAGVGAGLAQLIPTLATMLGPQTVTPYDEGFEEEIPVESGMNWGLILGGVALVGVVGGVIYMVTRDRDEDDED